MNNIVYESENIKYVKANNIYIDDYLKMLNDESVQKFISHQLKTFTYEGEVEWIKEKINTNAPLFTMITKDTNKFIGNIELFNFDNGNAELGIVITPDMQDKHYGNEAIKSILDYGFNKLDLKNIYLNVYKTNPRAIHVYENVGFVITGNGKTEEDYKMIYIKKGK